MRKIRGIRRTRLTNNRNTDDDFVSVLFIAGIICLFVFLIIGAVFKELS